MVQIKTQDSCFSKTTAPESPPDIRKSAARLRYFHHKDVRQLIAVKKESGFMKRSFIHCIRASADIRKVLQGLCGDVGYEGILNFPLKLWPPFHWLPGLMKGRFLRRRVLVRLRNLNSLLLSAVASRRCIQQPAEKNQPRQPSFPIRQR